MSRPLRIFPIILATLVLAGGGCVSLNPEQKTVKFEVEMSYEEFLEKAGAVLQDTITPTKGL